MDGEVNPAIERIATALEKIASSLTDIHKILRLMSASLHVSQASKSKRFSAIKKEKTDEEEEIEHSVLGTATLLSQIAAALNSIAEAGPIIKR
jgi:hypothetical protein